MFLHQIIAILGIVIISGMIFWLIREMGELFKSTRELNEARNRYLRQKKWKLSLTKQ